MPEQQENTPKKTLTVAQEIFVSSPDEYKNIKGGSRLAPPDYLAPVISLGYVALGNRPS